MIISSTLTAITALLLTWFLVNMATCPRAALGRLEEERRSVLRSHSLTYRTFEPWIDELQSLYSNRAALETRISQDLALAANHVPWRPSELIWTRRVESLGAALLVATIGAAILSFDWAWLFAIVGLFGYPWLMLRELSVRAAHRRWQIKRRMAPMIQLISLMIEVGSNFLEALVVAADESDGHPLGEELELVVQDIDRGKPRREALASFAKRIGDEETTELVSAIIEGEEMGTPMATILGTQAEQMRLKRCQWAEKAAEESKVLIVFPVMVIVVACLIIVVAPFLLTYVFEGM